MSRVMRAVHSRIYSVLDVNVFSMEVMFVNCIIVKRMANLYVVYVSYMYLSFVVEIK